MLADLLGLSPDVVAAIGTLIGFIVAKVVKRKKK